VSAKLGIILFVLINVHDISNHAKALEKMTLNKTLTNKYNNSSVL